MGCLVIDVFLQDTAMGLDSFWELKLCFAELSFSQATDCNSTALFSVPFQKAEQRDISSSTSRVQLVWDLLGRRWSLPAFVWHRGKELLGIVHGLCSDLLWSENITDLFLKYVLLLFCVSHTSQDLSKISFTYWALVRLRWLTMQHRMSREWTIFFSCESLF